MAITILEGDVRSRLADLPDQSVQCVVTSPPYFGLRDYGVSGQIGLESTLSEYVAALVDVFRSVRRVLRDDGTVFLNLGDSYAAGKVGRTDDYKYNRSPHGSGDPTSRLGLDRDGLPNGTQPGLVIVRKPTDGLKPKDLMMVPSRVAIALQDDGWYLRSDIIWAKRNPMPESVRDRPTSAHEHIFLLTKKARYFWDQDAVREDAASADRPKPTEDMKQRSPNGETPWLNNRYAPGPSGYGVNESGRNIRNVWSLSAEPLKEAHFAAFPTEIPRRCIKAGTSEKGACSACGAPWVRVVERTGGRDWRQDMMKPKGIPGERAGEGSYKRGQSTSPLNDTQRVKTVGWQPGCTCDAGEPIPCTVLDPFSGSGRTLFVAEELGRDSIGIELNAAYIDLSVRHIEQKTGYSVQRD